MTTHCRSRNRPLICPYKNGPGEINVPVVIGGKVVHPSDIIVGDEDGVIIIDPAIASEIADATEAVEKKEADIMKHTNQEGVPKR